MAEANQRLNTKATVAGGGAGTVWLALAQQIPDNYVVAKTIALYAAPFLSVTFTALWVLAAAWLSRKRQRADIDSAMARAIAIRDRVCNDPSATEDHKADVRKRVEAFEKLTIELLQSEFDAVRAELTV